MPSSLVASRAQFQTLASFDWQWAHLPDGDFMPGDPWFDANARWALAEEMCAILPEWFEGKRVLDAGCGQGRWTKVLLELGARVTAIDFSEAGLVRTRAIAGDTDRLTTRRVDLLDIPSDLARERFDLVFSFGVLHHTGDTWRALENVARLVADGGAMFLYLYGERSWAKEERERIERLRQSLARVPFEEKIAELRRRFPSDDPHQLFDLLSPVINDRVLFEDVAARLSALGFERSDQTISDNEVYVRALRPGFPEAALLPVVAKQSRYREELAGRFLHRKGAAFEDQLRTAVSRVAPRTTPRVLLDAVAALTEGTAILDVSFAPDRVRTESDRQVRIENWSGPSIITPGIDQEQSGDVVIMAGAVLGACRFPELMLLRLWERVRPGGRLLVEIAPDGFGATRRSLLERLYDVRADVPRKLANLLVRHVDWCSGAGLYALGEASLLNPVTRERAEEVLRAAGCRKVSWTEARPGTLLLRAECE
ncbi:MAG: class I SAM-dependent methyltransferase [Anaerolineae bacterium]|nr:class I SAM-dependent methyltransferase [Gemmatimonadaceae bacterium]